MRALLVDRLGFEKILSAAEGNTIIYPRKFERGESSFVCVGRTAREGEEFSEYREVDDMAEELVHAYSSLEYARRECRRREARITSLESENGELALSLHRLKAQKS